LARTVDFDRFFGTPATVVTMVYVGATRLLGGFRTGAFGTGPTRAPRVMEVAGGALNWALVWVEVVFRCVAGQKVGAGGSVQA
jgi:hypothetical protein